jgi:hypothetical protein
METTMNRLRKTTLIIAITATAALSSAAFAQPDQPPAWSFGGRNSPFISPSDVGFPRLAPNAYRKNLVRENPQSHVAYY